MRTAALTLALNLLATPTRSQEAPHQEPAQPTIKAYGQEVLLDVVVRDKKGRTVRDLRAGEFEVLDDGAPVRIKSFRLAEGHKESAAPAEAPPAAEPSRPTPSFDPLRQIRLV